jgi:ATP-dependent Zn protease
MKKCLVVVAVVEDNFSTSVKSKSKTFDEKRRCKNNFKDVAGLEGAKKKYKKL